MSEQLDESGFPVAKPTLDPTLDADVEALVGTIQTLIEQSSVELYEGGHRTHLGASVIGDKCSRKLWYMFRWVQKSNFASKHKTHGQMMRLFQRGHREEPAIMEVLVAAGFTFEPPTEGEDQHRMTKLVGGHYGGSIDAIGLLPARFNFAFRVLFEFKTSSTSEFRRLKKDGVKLHRPTHWAQMCTYGKDKNIHYALYIVVNKDTDEIYMEFLVLNHDLANTMEAKALAIITSGPEGPPKAFMTPTDLYCKTRCSFGEICHNGQAVEKNCRSCTKSVAVEGGKWHCTHPTIVATQPGATSLEINEATIPVGCDFHEGVQ